MPNNVTAKIKSAPKPQQLLAIALIVAAIIVVASLMTLQRKPALHIGDRSFALRIADTAEERMHGLSNTKSLPRNEAMLFKFEEPQRSCFWMKEMNYPLDIVWLSDAKKVVFIKQNAEPSSYPTAFCPLKPSKYVIELNAGEVKAAHITVGQQLDF